MTSKKKILWESWNAKISAQQQQPEPQQEEVSYEMPEVEISPEFFMPVQSRLIYTPMGAYPEESILKPSDRWDCWIAHTNFPITGGIANILNTEIDGIEVLKVMGKYSFFIGVAQLFDIRDVREKINNRICSYTEYEIFSNDEVQETVDLLKDQLKDNKYWSIIVSPEGNGEYVVANEINV